MAQAALQVPLRVLDAQLDGRDHILGPSFGVADLDVASIWVAARLAKLDLSAHPHVDAWMTRCTSRPALARAAAK